MTKAELIAAFRNVTGDLTTPYLWSDAEITVYLNEAEAEAAVRAKLLVERSAETYCKVAVVAGTAAYAVNPLVLEITRARIAGTILPLGRTTFEALDNSVPGWEDASGSPVAYIFDGKSIQLYPKPIETADLWLTVERLPVVMGTSPEIPARYHSQMMSWAYHLAYSKQDADTNDEALAAKYEGAFIRSFGERPDANVQRKHLDHRPALVRNNGAM